MKNIIKNFAISFLFIALMYIFFAIESNVLLVLTLIGFVLFCVNMVWVYVHKERMNNPEYIAQKVAGALRKWRTDSKLWLDKGLAGYAETTNELEKVERLYFKLWERYSHDKNKRLEIVKDWATFVSSSIDALDIDIDNIDPEAQKTREYLQIRIDEVKKRFEKLDK